MTTTDTLPQIDPTPHTAGDWNIDVWSYPGATPPRKDLVIHNETNLIATLAWDQGQENPYTIPHAEALANARLMQSAPYLLAVLKEQTRLLDQYLAGSLVSMPTAIRQQARHAIAKAEGRQS